MFKSGTESQSDKPGAERSADSRPHGFGAELDPTQPRAVPESEVLAREIKDGSLSGYVGHGTVIKGETSFKGMLRVDGRVYGHLSSDSGTIVVGDGGCVDANLTVAVALIRGTVNGDIIASQRIELGRTAKVTGNIQTHSLSLEQGAIFEGQCRMSTAFTDSKETKKEPVKSPVSSVPEYGAIAAGLNAAAGDDIRNEDTITNSTNSTN